MKLYFFNLWVFLVSFTNIESFLKIILLVVSIVYTIIKLTNLLKQRYEDKEDRS
jgi:hypothetical protein